MCLQSRVNTKQGLSEHFINCKTVMPKMPKQITVKRKYDPIELKSVHVRRKNRFASLDVSTLDIDLNRDIKQSLAVSMLVQKSGKLHGQLLKNDNNVIANGIELEEDAYQTEEMSEVKKELSFSSSLEMTDEERSTPNSSGNGLEEREVMLAETEKPREDNKYFILHSSDENRPEFDHDYYLEVVEPPPSKQPSAGSSFSKFTNNNARDMQ